MSTRMNRVITLTVTVEYWDEVGEDVQVSSMMYDSTRLYIRDCSLDELDLAARNARNAAERHIAKLSRPSKRGKVTK